MTNYKRILLGSMIAALTSTGIGCGQGFQSGSSSSAGSVGSAGVNNGPAQAPVDISEQLKAAEQATKEAEVALSEADLIVAEILDGNGQIKVGLFTKAQQSSAPQSKILGALTDKLQEVFDKVFAKIEQVKAKLDGARLKLADAVAKLDRTNPAQEALYQNIMSQMRKLDLLEAKFRRQMRDLAGKLDRAIDALDKLISGVTSFIPGFGPIVGIGLDFFIMGDVKDLIRDLQDRLLSL